MMTWSLVFVVTLTLVWPQVYAQDASCTHGFSLLGENCYGYFDNAKTWSEAANTCALMGAFLAEPKTFQENIFVKGFALDHGGDHVWIGGEDMATEGHWYWTHSGTLVSEFTDWLTGEPGSQVGDEDCMALWVMNRHWVDAPCSYKNGFICQKPAVSVVVG